MIRGTQIKAVPKPEHKVNTNIHNRFDIEVVDAATGKVKQRARGFNVICNNLWNRMINGNTYFEYIHYGTGTGTPSTGDANLFGHLGYAQAQNLKTNLDLYTGIYSARKSIQIAAGTAVGKNITEVGIAYGAGNTLCTHAMLEDMNGNPASIAKTDTDVINIYATIYVHFDPKGYDNGSVSFNWFKNTQAVYNWIAGIGNISWGAYAGYAVSDSMNHVGMGYVLDFWTRGGTEVAVTVTRDVNARKVTLKANRLEAPMANVGGLQYIIFGENYATGVAAMIDVHPGGGWFQNSVITGEAVGTGDGSTVDYTLAFPFAHDAKVYVDDVEVTDFTLEYGPVRKPYSEWIIMPLRKESTVDHHIQLFDFSNGNTFYNRAYEVGLEKLKLAAQTVYASNDLENWEQVITLNAWQDTVIPEAFRHYKYWRLKVPFGSNGNGYWSDGEQECFKLPASYTGKTLHLASPPPENSIITVDYISDVIAKDANHVFDITLVLQFGEYTESQ